MSVTIHHGDCIEVMRGMEAATFDAIVTDPPYGLAFMGKAWDLGVPDVPTWAEALRVAKPGAFMVAFGGARTYHRMACAIEDAGWEIRDCIMWLYGTGFPKAKSCLKPAHEPIILARKPGEMRALGVDECRVGETTRLNASAPRADRNGFVGGFVNGTETEARNYGRWPANVAHDGSDEVMDAFAVAGERKSGALSPANNVKPSTGWSGGSSADRVKSTFEPNTGTAARFYFCAKASPSERAGAKHPTIKPLALMEWLTKLVCPPGGLVLDPFAGSGTTGIAAANTGRRAVLIEREAEYVEMTRARIERHALPLMAAAE